MDTKHLETFLMLAKEKSYSSASLQLNYAPSTLVGHMKTLEEELHVKLVERRGNSICLTADGQRFLSYAEKMLSLYAQACGEIEHDLPVQGLLRVGAAESIGQYSMTNVFKEYATAQPSVELSIQISDCTFFPARLKNGEMDIAYLYTMDAAQIPGLTAVPLFMEELVLVAHPHHPLSGRAVITPADLANAMLMLTYPNCCYAKALKQLLAVHGVSPAAQQHMGSVSMIRNLAKQNFGVTLLPRCVVSADISAGKLQRLKWTEDPLFIQANLVYSKGQRLSAAARKLVDLSVCFAQGDKTHARLHMTYKGR